MSADFAILQIEKRALEGVLLDFLPFLAEHYGHLAYRAREDDNSAHRAHAKRDQEEIRKAVEHLIFVAGDSSEITRLSRALFPNLPVETKENNPSSF